MSSSKYEAKKIDPLFDGHLEITSKEMTPDERLELLWQLVEFRYIVTNRINPKSEISNE
jgi:hypothetical protein